MNEIEKFYDNFSQTAMLRDLRFINARLEAIKRLCDRFVPANASVLEVGCGTGLISKYLSKKGHEVLGVDISPKAIALAKRYSPKCRFQVLDVENSWISLDCKFNAVLLFDVLEHISKDKHAELFSKIDASLSAAGVILINLPAFHYHSFIQKETPQILQIVDQPLRVDEIFAITPLLPVHLDYVLEEKYVQIVFARPRAYQISNKKISLLARINRLARKLIWRTKNRSLLRKVELCNAAFAEKPQTGKTSAKTA